MNKKKVNEYIKNNNIIKGRFGAHGDVAPVWDTINLQDYTISYKQELKNCDWLFILHGIEFCTEDLEAIDSYSIPMYVVQSEKYIFEFIIDVDNN